MELLTISTVFSLLIAIVPSQNCPDGGAVYERGINNNGRQVVVNEHNRIRRMILNGQVPNQPRGKDILMIRGHDEKLAREGRKVSNQCRMNHVIAHDPRWNWVGQNLYISRSSANTPGQNWTAAINSWYQEHKNFIYPNGHRGVVGHYTQVVWHNSNTLGCDFIRFYDKSKPQHPYAKLYTCNYGPGGNYAGQAPYAPA